MSFIFFFLLFCYNYLIYWISGEMTDFSVSRSIIHLNRQSFLLCAFMHKANMNKKVQNNATNSIVCTRSAHIYKRGGAYRPNVLQKLEVPSVGRKFWLRFCFDLLMFGPRKVLTLKFKSKFTATDCREKLRKESKVAQWFLTLSPE